MAYVSPRSGSSSGYVSPRSSTSSGYVSPRSSSGGSGSAPAPKKHRGSFFSLGSGIVPRAISDLADAAIHTPGGIYHLARDVGHDIGPAGAKGKFLGRTRRDLKAMAQATAQDLQHPLRHPGYTLLDLITLGSAGAGAIGRAAEVGRTGEIGALIRGAKPAERVLTTPEGVKVTTGQYSRAYGTRAVQKSLDKLREKHPTKPIVGRPLTKKVGFQLERQRHLEDVLKRAPGSALALRGSKLNAAENYALRIVAEGVPIEKRLERHRADLAAATKQADKFRLRGVIKLTKNAEKYVENKTGPGGHLRPRFKPEAKNVAEVYKALEKANLSREEMLRTADLLTPEIAKGRLSKPAQFYGHQGEGEQYVPYGKRKPASTAVRMGANKMIGVPGKPGSLRTFEGTSISRGLIETKTAQAVAQAQAEAAKITSVLDHRQRFLDLSQEMPGAKGRWIPIREDKNVKLSAGERDLLNRAVSGEHVASQDVPKLNDAAKRIYEQVFPSDVSATTVLEQGYPIKGIRWVREDYLGSLNKPQPLVGAGSYPSTRRVLGGIDAINNASKLAILYLKPAYAIPNLLGNAALNIIQQGFAAPKNLARAVRIYQHLSPDAIAAGDAVLGEGVMTSIAHNPGLLSGPTNKLAGGWSKLVDRRLRWSSLLHEANRANFKDWQSVERLLTDKSLRPKLVNVAQEANSEIIDYARLGPHERDIIRRVIFFYPWVKGSTIYTARMVGEHPGKSYVLASAGRQESKRVQKQLGDLPSWAQGIFPVGKRGSNPLIVNPASASLFGTPAQVLKTIQGLNQGNVGSAYQAGTMLTPAAGLVLTAISGQNSFGSIPANQGNLTTAFQDLYGGLPQVTLLNRVRQDQSQKTYPLNWRDALLQYLIGGIAPRPANLAKLHSAAAREKTGR